MRTKMVFALLLACFVPGCSEQLRRELFYPGGYAAYERDVQHNQKVAAFQEIARVHAKNCHGQVLYRTDRECVEDDLRMYAAKAELVPQFNELLYFAQMQAERVFRGQITRAEFDYLVVQKDTEIANRLAETARANQRPPSFLSFEEWLRRSGPMRGLFALDSAQAIEIYKAEMGLPSSSLRCVSRRDVLGQIVTECR